jgi:hypothetical protein
MQFLVEIGAQAALTVSSGSPSVQAPMKRAHRMNEDEFEEEAEGNLFVETDDEIRAGPVSFMSRNIGRQ